MCRRIVRDLAHARAVGVHDVELGLAAAGAHEGDVAAVRREHGGEVLRRIRRQPPLALAIHVHHVDVPVAGAVALQDDLLAIWRPGGFEARLRIVRQLTDALPIRIHDEHLRHSRGAVAHEGDAAIGREGGGQVVAPLRGNGRHVRAVGGHPIQLEMAIVLALENDCRRDGLHPPPVGFARRPRTRRRQGHCRGAHGVHVSGRKRAVDDRLARSRAGGQQCDGTRNDESWNREREDARGARSRRH